MIYQILHVISIYEKLMDAKLLISLINTTITKTYKTYFEISNVNLLFYKI